MKRMLLLFFVLVLAACGGDDKTGNRTQGGTAAPRISVVAPQQVAVGEKVEVVGSNFAGGQAGQVLLRFEGQFIDDQGQEHPIDQTFEAQVEDSTRVSWTMWPDVVFHPEGNRLGYFLGEIQAINQGLDGSQRASDGYRVKMDVGPSLLVRVLRPARSQCPMVVRATNGDLPLSIAVEALGFEPGSEAAPLEFTWTFGLEGFEVSPNFGTFDSEQRIESARGVGTATVVERVTSGTLSGLQDASGCDGVSGDPDMGVSTLTSFITGLCRENQKGERQLLFKTVSDFLSVPGLKVLRTRKIETDGRPSHVQAPISVIVRDVQGRTGSLAIPIDVHPPVEIKRDASRDRILMRDEAVKIQDDVTVGGLPTEVSLRESKSEQRNIEAGHNLSPSYYNQLGFIYGTNLTWTFGFDVRTGSTKSEDSAVDTSVQVPAGWCLSYYRQAEQVAIHAQLIGHTACGQREEAGELVYKVWQWQREPATSPSGCPAPITQLKQPGPCVSGCEVIRREGAASSVAPGNGSM